MIHHNYQLLCISQYFRVCLHFPIIIMLSCIIIFSMYLNILRYRTTYLGLPKEELCYAIIQSCCLCRPVSSPISLKVQKH